MRTDSEPGRQRDDTASITVGITGHRRHRLGIADAVVEARMEAVFAALRRASGRGRDTDAIEVVSALAEGADEIAARVALRAHLRLTALLPFKARDYERTFSDTGYRRTFQTLLAAADQRIELAGSLERREDAYVAVGRGTLDRSDLVVTLWDGEAAQGRGGTPEVLQAALMDRLPIVWIDAKVDRSPRLIMRSRFGPCPRLASAAGRAVPFDAAKAVAGVVALRHTSRSLSIGRRSNI